MTSKVLGLTFLVALILLAPLSAAEADSGNTTSERPDDAAWVEDCPPDMMCAASSPDEDKENVTRGDDCDLCRDHQEDDCVDCLGSPMPADDTTWGTDCPPGMYCISDGSPSGGDDAAPSDEEVGPVADEAPGVGAIGFLAALGLTLTAFVAGLRRD